MRGVLNNKFKDSFKDRELFLGILRGLETKTAMANKHRNS